MLLYNKRYILTNSLRDKKKGKQNSIIKLLTANVAIIYDGFYIIATLVVKRLITGRIERLRSRSGNQSFKILLGKCIMFSLAIRYFLAFFIWNV